MTKVITDYEKALNNLKKDSVKITTIEPMTSGDNYLIIETPHYKTTFGVNDLGIWVHKQERREIAEEIIEKIKKKL